MAPASSQAPGLEVPLPFESIAPEAAPLTSRPPEITEAEALPLVNVASTASHAATSAPPLDDVLNLDSEVSEVRVTTGVREPVQEVTVAAIAAEAEPEVIGPEELSEDDLVDLTDTPTLPPPPAAASDSDMDLDFPEEDEQPPASSKRMVAASMDEALATAAAQLEAAREVPIKTPPPESGPQEAPPPSGALAAPPAPDVDALLAEELDIPTHEAAPLGQTGLREPERASDMPTLAGPTAEQLGQTIELEAPSGPSPELDEPPATLEPRPTTSIEELEVALPAREVAVGYADDLPPPPSALEDLEAHRRRMADDAPPPPESFAQLPSAARTAPAAAPVEAHEEAAPDSWSLEPQVVARPIPVEGPQTIASLREPFKPSSFVELLDASLALSAE